MSRETKLIGAKLRQSFSEVLSLPMNWPVIDALCRLDESQPEDDSDARIRDGRDTDDESDDQSEPNSITK